MKFYLLAVAAMASPFAPKMKGMQERLAVKNLKDDTACEIGCVSADAACELACALEIFGEPECGIACLAIEPVCEAACAAEETGLREEDVTTIMSDAVYQSGICQGRQDSMPVANTTLAHAFCNHFHMQAEKHRGRGRVGDSDCDDACTATEVACEVVCAIDIFDEPECGIACLAVEAACEAACGRRRAEGLTDLDNNVKYIMGNFMQQSQFCQGETLPNNGDNFMSMVKMCGYHHGMMGAAMNVDGYCPDYCN